MTGAMQFILAVTMGLRPHHRLLDVGCGSHGSGRFLLANLEPENHYGIELNAWLVDDAFRLEVGHQLREMRRPHFAGLSRAHACFSENSLGFTSARRGLRSRSITGRLLSLKSAIVTSAAPS